MAKKAKGKAGKVTSFEAFKTKYGARSVDDLMGACSIEDLMGVMKPLNPLGVSSEKDILDQMKTSGDPTLAAFAKDLERQMKGEKVDLRKYSDL